MRLLIILTALLALSACAQNPVSGRTDFVMMSESQEVATGRAADADVKKQYRVYESKALQDYVNDVGQRLAQKSHRPELEYHFTVLDSPEINAFALPGGYIYITRGIMAYLNSEAELAAVIGHEIGHVTARHGVRQQSSAQMAGLGLTIASIFLPTMQSATMQNLANTLGTAWLSGYGRDHELEADRLGASYLAQSGYDPQAIISVIRVLKNQELRDAQIAQQEGREPRRYHGLFASHPDNDTRLQQAVGEAAAQQVAASPYRGRDAFLDVTDGMVFNDNTEQGVVRNNHFYHAELGLALRFPESWRIHNLPETLIAISPQGAAQLQLQMDQQPHGSPAEYARQLAGYDARIRSLDINGLPAATIELGNTVAAIVYLNGYAYLLRGEAQTPQHLAAYREDIVDTLMSFHALTNRERHTIKPLVIRVIKARQNDSFAKLAQRSPLGASAESYLRLINAMYSEGEPRAGQFIKIVE